MKPVRASLLTVVALTLLALGLAGTAAPATAAPAVTVTPATGLVDGSAVRVVADGLTPGAPVEVRQCDTYAGDPDYDCPAVTTVSASGTGRLSLSLTVSALVFRSEPFGEPDPVYCRADACRVWLSWTDATGTPQVVSSRRLVFRGAPATIAVTPSSGLRDAQPVRVTGTAVGAAGRTVEVVEHACFGIVQGSGCYGELRVRTATVQPGGGWSTPYAVRRVLSDGSDCTDPDILGSCVLSATVLGPDGQPDDSFGVARLGQPSAGLDFATG